MVTEEEFEKAIGWPPNDDDMERVNCKTVGDIGHWSCGWCNICDKPRFECGHLVYSPLPNHQGQE